MYDIKYYDQMLKQYSGTAEHICRKRWDFVSQINPRVVLDYGSGVGWFRAFAPYGVTCDTYDIMPVFQTGLEHSRYDLVTFWDSLEHMSVDNIRNTLNIADAVALTVPIKPKHLPWASWKHFKPGEHLWYPRRGEVIETFKDYGFEIVEMNQNECPPREDVWSFLFVRSDAATKKTDTFKRPVPRRHPAINDSDPGSPY